MDKLNVLIACEESQRICIAFREKGHNAFSCDIKECSGGHPEWHIQGDVLIYVNGNCEFYTSDNIKHVLSDKWDIIIAHPPCTYLSKAGARWLYPTAGKLDMNRYKLGLEAKRFFMALYNCDCDMVCIENPIPLKIFNLPCPTQIVQPYQFGEPYSKATLLWLRGLNPLIPTKIIDDYKPYIPSNTGGAKRGQSHSVGFKSFSNASERSKTFYGIAAAMADQWS